MANGHGSDMQGRLAVLRIAHGDLDAAIAALTDQAIPDQLQLARLKRRKLRMKDEMVAIEAMLIPDIIA